MSDQAGTAVAPVHPRLAADLVVGERVSLGGFVPVTLLILTPLPARSGVRRLLHVPDEQPTPQVDAR